MFLIFFLVFTLSCFPSAFSCKQALLESFFDAATRGDVQKVSNLIDAKQVSVNQQNQKGMSALHIAVQKNHIILARKLIKEHKATVDIYDKFKTTPLHYAAEKRDFDLAKLLILNKANINARDCNNQTPLHKIFEHKQDWYAPEYLDNVQRIIQLFIEYRADLSVVDSTGKTVLYKALYCFGAYEPILSLLATHGAPEISVDSNEIKIVKQMERDNKSSSEDFFEEDMVIVTEKEEEFFESPPASPPVHQKQASQELKKISLAQFLALKKTINEKFFQAVKAGDLNKVSYFLKQYTFNIVNAFDDHRATALHHAAGRGHNEIIRHLIEHKALVNAQDQDGQTPLHWATRNKKADSMKLLCSSSADLLITDRDKKTPIIMAAEIAQQVIQNKSDQLQNLKQSWLDWLFIKK